jgi:hypothetical protein
MLDFVQHGDSNAGAEEAVSKFAVIEYDDEDLDTRPSRQFQCEVKDLSFRARPEVAGGNVHYAHCLIDCVGWG